jgi:ribosomal protein S18 acetylase RimI-like enzyme
VSAVDIRLAGPDDYEAVDQLVREAYEHDYGPRDHDEPPQDDDPRLARVRSRGYDVWVAIDHETGELVGTVTSRRAGGPGLMEDSHDDEIDLRLLGVAPSARRRGVGALLTRHVETQARRQGFDAVFLKSAPHMLGAHRLYESLGYRRAIDRDGLIIDGRKVFDLFAFSRRLEPVGPAR